MNKEYSKLKSKIQLNKFFKENALKSRALIVLFSIILLATIISTIYLFIYKTNNQAPDGTGNSVNLSDVDRDKIINEISDEAETLLADNKKEEAIDLYEQKIKLTSDSIVRDSLIIEKTNIYLNDDNYLSALDDIKNVVNPNKSSDIEEYLAQFYLSIGDNDQAIVHYKRAIEYTSDDYVMANGEIEYFEDMIDSMGSS